ncbi:hypothetical protein J3Q64DRAFT_1695846 [Phycomyces blakesleeanus]|uniref:Uncharacterized protein n=1 Tax=Phycomyces blakesleeanus TaxID=4837 RepID=A0ABR3B6T4_PHYBL
MVDDADAIKCMLLNLANEDGQCKEDELKSEKEEEEEKEKEKENISSLSIVTFGNTEKPNLISLFLYGLEDNEQNYTIPSPYCPERTKWNCEFIYIHDHAYIPLPLSSYINQSQANEYIASNINAAFLQSSCWITDSWSSPYNQYQNPIRGIRLSFGSSRFVFLGREGKTKPSKSNWSDKDF